jgi:hypothetical protein
MKTPVQLHQLAEVRFALPPLTMFLALSPSTPQPFCQHPKSQGFMIHQLSADEKIVATVSAGGEQGAQAWQCWSALESQHTSKATATGAAFNSAKILWIAIPSSSAKCSAANVGPNLSDSD